MLWWLLAALGGALLLREATSETAYTTPKGGKVTRWADLVKRFAKGTAVKPSMVLATIEHESGGSPTAVSYYRKSKAPYNDPAMPAEVKNGPREAIRDWMYANWSGHAYGLGQLIPETGAKYGGIVGAKYGRRKGGFPGDSFNPEKNIKGTVAFLDELMRKYSGDKRSVYAAYYAGAGNVKKRGREHYKKYIEASLNREATYHAFDQ